MNNVNVHLLVDMALDFKVKSEECASLDRIWKYMMYCFNYVPHTIVIGQTPYPEYLVPALGSAFSQVCNSIDTPTARVFGLHFNDQAAVAVSMMRNSWALAPRGYIFVNADYMPSNLGGGDTGIECVRRVNRTIELLFLLVMTKAQRNRKITVLAIGSLAAYCGSSLSRRLRSVGVSVEHLSCRQPAVLARLQYNAHLIGKDSRYMFAKPKVLLCFSQMIDIYSSCRITKVTEFTALHRSTMSSNKHNSMTFTAINQLLSKCSQIDTSLSQTMATPLTPQDCKAQLDDIKGLMKDINTTIQGLLNLLLADAYTYRTVVNNESKQVPVASREQHMQGRLEFGSEAESIDASSISKTSSVTQSTAATADGAKVSDMFRLVKKGPGHKITTPRHARAKPTKVPPSASSDVSRRASSSSSKTVKSPGMKTPNSLFSNHTTPRNKSQHSSAKPTPSQLTPLGANSSQKITKTPVETPKKNTEFISSKKPGSQEISKNQNMLDLLTDFEGNK